MDRDELIEALKHCALDKEEQCDGCPGENGICCRYMKDGSWAEVPQSLVKQVLSELGNATADYERGQRDAWELAQKILKPVIDGGYSHQQLLDIFGDHDATAADIITELAIDRAVARVKEYEKRIALHVGDEVLNLAGVRLVVLKRREDGLVYTSSANGDVDMYKRDHLTKTGRHFDELEQLMKKMQKE